MEPIRILQIVPNMQQGGIENFIMNIYRKIDRSKIQFDFLVHYKKEFFFDEEIKSLGGKIYYFSVMEDKNIIKYCKELDSFFKTHKEYKVIHGHMASLGGIYLNIAKKNNIPVRIAHSHGTSHLKTIKGYLKFFLFKFTKFPANIYWACSTEAGRYLYGKKIKFDVIPNAIDFNKFKFNDEVRAKLRRNLSLDDKIVIGHVGRFNLQKNHEFLIDVFNELSANDEYRLLLIGTGELEDKIKNQVKNLGLQDKVFFLENRSDVNELYQAMDFFVMPSLFEGLPVTGIEAQVSGLKCLFSAAITKETRISKNVEFLELNKIKWAEKIKSLNFITDTRKSVEITEEKFDIKNLSKNLQNTYLDLYNKNK